MRKLTLAFAYQHLPNGLRYPLVGGTRQRHFDGTNFKPRKLLKNAPTPTSRVHAVLGSFCSDMHPQLLESLKLPADDPDSRLDQSK